MLFRLLWFQSLGPLTVAGPAAHTQAAWTAMLPIFLPSSGLAEPIFTAYGCDKPHNASGLWKNYVANHQD